MGLANLDPRKVYTFYGLCLYFRSSSYSRLYNNLKRPLVSLKVAKASLELPEYSETLGLGLNQFFGLGLGLENETQIISVSDSVSILRL